MRVSRDLTPPAASTLLLSLGAIALGLVAAKRQIDSGNDVNALVCVAFASLLASPVSWTHHWVWAIPALLVLVQSRRWVASGLLAAIFVIAPMWFTPRGHFLELSHNWWQVAACLSYVVVGLTYLVFFALGLPAARGSRMRSGPT
jgi:alpha-1,2-mannosyltransferase